MVEPDGTDFARRHRDGARLLGLFDQGNELGDRQFAAVNGLVADDDGVDVAVMARQLDRGPDLAFIARLILADPGAHRDAQAKLGRNRRNQLRSTGRRIGADRLGEGRNRFQVGSDLRSGRTIAAVGMVGVGKRRVRDARELPVDIRSRRLGPQQAHSPACTHTTSASTAATVRIEHQPRGAKGHGPEPVPKVRRGS